MNFIHAFGFLVVGVISGLLPRWAPGLCAVTGVDGSSTRELWLQIMSAVQVGIAGLYFFQRLGSWLATVMPYALPDSETPVTAPRPALPASAAPAWRQGAATSSRPRVVLPVPATFDGALLQQRRAA